MHRIVLLVALSWIGMAFAAEPVPEAPIHLTPGAVTTPELVATLAERDQALFAVVFGCDIDALRPMIADDFEFLHDKHGKIADSGAKFVGNVADGCERQKAGIDFHSRRELVPGTLQTYALDHYGAVQLGTHRFYALRQGKPDLLTETSRFVDVWKLDGGAWKLSRVISYGHELDPAAAAPH
ncbi:nuclear transport factor 2 family protein [Pseudoluteimonas lycopersici]|uniref:Nuclear transport factor 2 family protein n=1 Tax=Pseudoluteimonas lycopersici TaxID=1324796 RepID=A0A516V768_9GAMM|nr:nuclear transport factor 2 family protein [Lysobacter lycopersici]QDQ74341.1 nuclear transport factor 2 family protein [Lysobacter lycopersici]